MPPAFDDTDEATGISLPSSEQPPSPARLQPPAREQCGSSSTAGPVGFASHFATRHTPCWHQDATVAPCPRPFGVGGAVRTVDPQDSGRTGRWVVSLFAVS